MDNDDRTTGEQREKPLGCLIGYGIAVILFALFFATFILAIHGGGH